MFPWTERMLTKSKCMVQKHIKPKLNVAANREANACCSKVLVLNKTKIELFSHNENIYMFSKVK